VSTAVPLVVTITLPDADANDEATEFKIWLADMVLYAVALKLHLVRTSYTSASQCQGSA
jgi:hypothetical protein